MMTAKTFAPISPVSLNTPPKTPPSGGNYAEIRGQRLYIDVSKATGLSWDEAIRLRDWLMNATYHKAP